MYKHDFYQALGVGKLATDKQIRTAYLSQALFSHPDKQPQNQDTLSSYKFEHVVAAYNVLKDPETRKAYDQWLQSRHASMEPHLTVDLDDMSCFSSTTKDGDSALYWKHPCRCGGEFLVEEHDLESGATIFPCSGCTARCRVVYFEST